MRIKIISRNFKKPESYRPAISMDLLLETLGGLTSSSGKAFQRLFEFVKNKFQFKSIGNIF